jgi:hypothetical protein
MQHLTRSGLLATHTQSICNRLKREPQSGFTIPLTHAVLKSCLIPSKGVRIHASWPGRAWLEQFQPFLDVIVDQHEITRILHRDANYTYVLAYCVYALQDKDLISRFIRSLVHVSDEDIRPPVCEPAVPPAIEALVAFPEHAVHLPCVLGALHTAVSDLGATRILNVLAQVQSRSYVSLDGILGDTRHEKLRLTRSRSRNFILGTNKSTKKDRRAARTPN